MARYPILLLRKDLPEREVGRTPTFVVNESSGFWAGYVELEEDREVDRDALKHFHAGLIDMLQRSADAYPEIDRKMRCVLRPPSEGLPRLSVVFRLDKQIVTLWWIQRCDQEWTD
jgi:hypothetical protein